MIEDISESRFEYTISNNFFEEDFEYYRDTFIQPLPAYGIKVGENWSTVQGNFGDALVRQHISGEKTYGSMGRYYPTIGAFDIDDVKNKAVLKSVIADVGFDVNNVLLQETSRNSYHVLFPMEYNSNKITIDLFHTIMDPIVKSISTKYRRDQKLSEIVVYPKSAKVLRAPFHPSCPVYYDALQLHTFEEKIETLKSLIPIDLKAFQKTKQQLGLTVVTKSVKIPITGRMLAGKDLYEHGLQSPRTRNDAFLDITLYLYRNNVTKDDAVYSLQIWTATKTNGFSRDVTWKPTTVQAEIIRVVDYVYDGLGVAGYFPDGVHNSRNGFFTEEVFALAAKHCGQNIPTFKFLCQLIAYQAGFGTNLMNIYSRQLQVFAARDEDARDVYAAYTKDDTIPFNRAYLKHIRRLTESGAISRPAAYTVGDETTNTPGIAKVCQLNFINKHSMPKVSAAYRDAYGRAMTFDESLHAVGRKTLYGMLTQNGISAASACRFLTNRGI